MKTPVLIILFSPLLARAAPFTLDSIERWTGSGPHRAALIVDWHDGTRPRALAWGFRFNPGATSLDLWNAVTAADPGLVGSIPNGPITYNRPTRPGDLLPGTANHPGLARWTAYTHDHADPGLGTWHLWTSGSSQGVYAQSNMLLNAASPASIPLAPDSWHAWSLATNSIPIPPARRPAAALHYPFATTVVKYDPGTGITRDHVNNTLRYNDPLTALGRPTVDTTGDNSTIPASSIVPVVPVFPASRAFEMVSVGTGGELVLGFDHRVYDNPENPGRAAFIVFGNAFQSFGNGKTDWANGDPNLTIAGGVCNTEGGYVEVGQNPNGPWHMLSPYPDVGGFGYADDFAPTLGRVYDPSNPDTTSPGCGNWWGGATDPTIPVPSPVEPDDIAGMTVAQIAARYRGSAGGTAFSIQPVAHLLDPDPDNGMAWIQYVRVTFSWTTLIPEVDAIADVSPALPVDLWRDEHFDWLEDPALEHDLADASGDGVPNLMKYALGRDPRAQGQGSQGLFEMKQYRAPDGVNVLGFTFTVNPNAHDLRVGVIRTDDLRAPSSEWKFDFSRPVRDTPLTSTTSTRLIEVPMTGPKGFMRLKVDYE